MPCCGCVIWIIRCFSSFLYRSKSLSSSFSCAPLVLIIATSDYANTFLPVQVSLFVVVSMEIFSHRPVQADRTWPVSSAGVRGQVLLFLNLPLFHQVPINSELNLCLSIQLICTHSVRVMPELWGLLREQGNRISTF